MLIGWQVDLWNTGSRRWATGPSALNQSPRSFLGLLREVQLICLGADTVIHIPPLLAHHFLVSKYEETLNKSSSNYFCLVSMSAAFLFETVYFYLFYIIRYKVHREKFTHIQTTSQFRNYHEHPCIHQAVQEVKPCLKFLYVPSHSLPPLSREKVIAVWTSSPIVYLCLFLNFM